MARRGLIGVFDDDDGLVAMAGRGVVRDVEAGAGVGEEFIGGRCGGAGWVDEEDGVAALFMGCFGQGNFLLGGVVVAGVGQDPAKAERVPGGAAGDDAEDFVAVAGFAVIPEFNAVHGAGHAALTLEDFGAVVGGELGGGGGAGTAGGQEQAGEQEQEYVSGIAHLVEGNNRTGFRFCKGIWGWIL